MQVRLDGRGRLLIPAVVRAQLSLMPGTKLDLDTEGDSIRLTPVRTGARRIVEIDGTPVLPPVVGIRVTDADVARWRHADQR